MSSFDAASKTESRSPPSSSASSTQGGCSLAPELHHAVVPCSKALVCTQSSTPQSSSSQQPTLEEIASLCLQLAPAKLILDRLQSIESWPRQSVQDLFVETCLQSAHQSAYPASFGWLLSLTKGIEKAVEQNSKCYDDDDEDDGCSLSEGMVELIVRQQTLKRRCSGDDDRGYVTYSHNRYNCHSNDNDKNENSTVFRVVRGAYNKVRACVN
jgi:hypothetical protein